MKCALNLENFEYKVEYISLNFSETIYSERAGLASEQHSVNNALTVSKHSLNKHGTTIILFFHEFGIY